MNLLPKDIANKLPLLGTHEHHPLEATAFAKFSMPFGTWRWYASEFDGHDTFFGLIVADGSPQLGNFYLSELQEMIANAGYFMNRLAVELDTEFQPTELRKLWEGHVWTRSIYAR
jgi:hypothetical protein